MLLVDDESALNAVMRVILRNEYEIDDATSGSEALRKAGSDTPPELLLLDGMDGFDVARKLREDEGTRRVGAIRSSQRRRQTPS